MKKIISPSEGNHSAKLSPKSVTASRKIVMDPTFIVEVSTKPKTSISHWAINPN